MKNLPTLQVVNDTTLVSGELNAQAIDELKAEGVAHIINFQASDELSFDEAKTCQEAGIGYTHLPIANADALTQLNIMAFDKALRQQHGKKILMHCKTGNRVGAAMALRAGWLRGRKMDTALQTGKEHGLTGWEETVKNKLLVPS